MIELILKNKDSLERRLDNLKTKQQATLEMLSQSSFNTTWNDQTSQLKPNVPGISPKSLFRDLTSRTHREVYQKVVFSKQYSLYYISTPILFWRSKYSKVLIETSTGHQWKVLAESPRDQIMDNELIIKSLWSCCKWNRDQVSLFLRNLSFTQSNCCSKSCFLYILRKT